MSNNVSVPKEVFENVVAVLRMYAESEWGWDGEDNSVVRSWGEVYPEPKGFHFKDGGDMAKIALGELQRLLTPRAVEGATRVKKPNCGDRDCFECNPPCR